MDVCEGMKEKEVWVYLCLNGGRSLGAQHLDSLKDVHHSFVSHPLQHDAEGDEHTGPPYSSTEGE